MNIQALIDQLRAEGEILNKEYQGEHYEFQPGETMNLAAYALEMLRRHVDQLFPYMLQDIQQGLRLGPPPEGHDADNCSDCQWYAASIELRDRINSGEYNYTSD